MGIPVHVSPADDCLEGESGLKIRDVFQACRRVAPLPSRKPSWVACSQTVGLRPGVEVAGGCLRTCINEYHLLGETLSLAVYTFSQ